MIVMIRVNQKVIAAMLVKLGYKPDLVDDGHKAVEAVKRRALAFMTRSGDASTGAATDAKSPDAKEKSLPCYDLVLMDMQVRIHLSSFLASHFDSVCA